MVWHLPCKQETLGSIPRGCSSQHSNTQALEDAMTVLRDRVHPLDPEIMKLRAEIEELKEELHALAAIVERKKDKGFRLSSPRSPYDAGAPRGS